MPYSPKLFPFPASTMGCAGSKLEEPDAVARCRGRSELLAEAIRHRYALADAHAAYADSLHSIGAALHGILSSSHGTQLQGSPILPLPAQRKGDPLPPLSPPSPPAAVAAIRLPHSHSRSHSGSHIHFHSSNGSDSDSDSPLHSDDDSPVHLHPIHHETYFNLHYARNNPPPLSVSFEQHVGIPEQVHYASFGGPSSSSIYPNGYQYPDQNTISSPYPFPYTYQSSPHGYSEMDDFLGSSSPTLAISQHPQKDPEASFKASISRAAPPPPSPAKTSTWDFLNPFESFESYYPSYTPSRSSKELREDEEIPDLEDDEQEVIKEAYGDQKFAASTPAKSTLECSSEGSSVAKNDVGGSLVDGSHFHPMPTKDDEDVVEKKAVGEVQKSLEEKRHVFAPSRFHDVSEVAGEIRFQFDRSAESTKELASMLEVGKLPYNRKNSVYAASSRIMSVIPVSMSKHDDLDYEEEKVMRTGNLSSTLQKLYIWEQKLYDEVRIEEKIRLLLDRSSKRLQQLDKRGAEAHKIEATQTLIRKLSTKIRISIQVVNSVSAKISMLRDEELWPQIEELIQGLERMWRALLECHQIQSQAMSESDTLDSFASERKLSQEHKNALMQLELELLRWTVNFSSLINSQKNFVKSLNTWLLLCVCHKSEVTADGTPPYSPGMIGAPPVFDVFNNWSQALDKVSMKEVLDAVHSSAASLRQLHQENDVDPHRNMIAIKDVERLNKQLVLSSGKDDLPLSQALHGEPIGLQSALRQVFQALESFATNAMNAYGDLIAHAVEGKPAIEDAKSSQV